MTSHVAGIVFLRSDAGWLKKNAGRIEHDHSRGAVAASMSYAAKRI